MHLTLISTLRFRTPNKINVLLISISHVLPSVVTFQKARLHFYLLFIFAILFATVLEKRVQATRTFKDQNTSSGTWMVFLILFRDHYKGTIWNCCVFSPYRKRKVVSVLIVSRCFPQLASDKLVFVTFATVRLHITRRINFVGRRIYELHWIIQERNVKKLRGRCWSLQGFSFLCGDSVHSPHCR